MKNAYKTILKTAAWLLPALALLPFPAGADTVRRTVTTVSTQGDGEYCREYTRTIVIGGRKQQGYGTACMEPDGTWRIASAESGDQEEEYDERAEYRVDGRPVRIVFASYQGGGWDDGDRRHHRRHRGHGHGRHYSYDDDHGHGHGRHRHCGKKHGYGRHGHGHERGGEWSRRDGGGNYISVRLGGQWD